MSGLISVRTIVRAEMDGVLLDQAVGEDLYPVEQERFTEMTFQPGFQLHTPLGRLDVQVVMQVEVSPPLVFDTAEPE